MEKKLKLKNYIGYGICDLGNNIGFSCASTYLTLFYTDVIGSSFDSDTFKIWGIIISAIMIIARIWDGINDPMMGIIAQNRKPTKYGKFKPLIIYGGIPLALAFVIMFLPIKNMSLVVASIFAFVTYIAYGMLYTVVLVPYGSVASVMTRDENERSILSIARSIGGGIGGIPTGMLFPLLVYTEVGGTSYLDGTKLLIGVVIIAVIMVASYLIGAKNIEENYPYTETASESKVNVKGTIKSLLKNKPFMIIGIVGMLLIASSMYINSMYVYLFNVYFQRKGFMTLVTIATYIPMIAFIPFTGKIINKIGKKEMIVPSLLLATIVSFIMFVWKITNPYIFLVFVFLVGIGIGFITLEIWALCMDVIDYQELKTGLRQEAPTYSFFTFLRKIGQALAAFTPLILSLIGYVSTLKYEEQSSATALAIYNVSTLIPFILFLIMFVLMLFYPLNKKNYIKMKEELKIKRGE